MFSCFLLFFVCQVKPLLQVTRQDEEIQARESQLQKAKDNLTRAEQDYAELDRKHAQVNNTSTARSTMRYESVPRSSQLHLL